MEEKELQELIHKFQSRTCTEEEKQRLFEWYNQYDDLADQLPATPSEKLDALWKPIESHIKQNSRKKILFMAMRVAAVILLLFSATVTIHLLFIDKNAVQPVLAEQQILPAHGVPVLVLADGKQIPLKSSLAIDDQDGTPVVNHQESCILDYTESIERPAVKAEKASDSEEQQPIYNTVKVPVGGEYKVVLADGTKVHLNSCSSLTYPVRFTGEQRNVELVGEAFFEVAKGKKPFIVKATDVDVKVYGTTFNVSCYEEDAHVVTALVEGKVNVYDRFGDKEYEMQPGIALTYSRIDNRVSMDEVDMTEYTSWVYGKFLFKNARLEDIMNVISRWYGCDIYFDNDAFRNRRLSGTAIKDQPVNILLDNLEKISNIDFKTSNNTIIIQKKSR